MAVRTIPPASPARLALWGGLASLMGSTPAALAAQRPVEPPPGPTRIEEGRLIDGWVLEDHGRTESCARILVTADASGGFEGPPADGPVELRRLAMGETTRVCIPGSTPVTRASDEATGASGPIDVGDIELGSRVRMWVEDYQFQTNPPRVRAVRIQIQG